MEWHIRALIVVLAIIMVGCRSAEVSYGKSLLDPHPVDSDNDMLTDFEEEACTETDPYNADTDGDGLPDGWEWFSGLDPLNAIGLDGANGDPYFEGVTNIEKYRREPNKYENRGAVYEVPK